MENLVKIMGALFIALSGILFTCERIAVKMATGINNIGTGSQYVVINGPGLFSNFFVWFFFFFGFVLLIVGFYKKN